MNKENEMQSSCTPNEALTHEQRNRISLNFEAAKTLRARKRPRFCSNKTTDVSGWRVPLKELPANIVSLDTLDGSTRGNEKSRGHCQPQKMPSADGFAEDREYHFCNTMPCAGNFVEELLSAPKHTSDFDTTPGLLDEDFNECILREIDALCNEQSAQKLRTQVDGGDDEKHIGSAKKAFQAEEADMVHTEQADEILNMHAEYSKYMLSLNQDQLGAASCDVSIPLMVVAGPGSGKTSTMVGRILMLLSEGMVPSHILAMTFTTAAASEMRERIGAIAGKKIAKELTISTFHSFSLQLCRSHAEKLGRTADFLIFGHAQQRRAVTEALRLSESIQSNRNFSGPKFRNVTNSPLDFKDKSKNWLKFVTQAKASGETADDCRERGDEIQAMILSNYNDTLKACNALDYHDLISESVKLLNNYPEVMKECQESWGAIIIDEFQDTSAMQYKLLRHLAGHGRITVVGDEDQSIFGFNGADLSGFDAFRKDFSNHKEIRLKNNYRSTRCIVEASASLIQNNRTRCLLKEYVTDNCSGERITIKECQNEDAQSAFVVDKVMEMTSDHSNTKCSFGSIAILYRRQVTGKIFQSAFRSRKIPFNVHGVAFYRKKVIKAIIAMLKTTLPACDDGPFRQVFKAFLPVEKEEKKKVIEHVDRISTIHKHGFMLAASDIFGAKISGTLKRSQLSQGRKVLKTIEMISKLVEREASISAVVSCVGNLLPQSYLLEKRAIVDAEGGKFLNEDNDLRSVIQYLLDDVNEFLSTKFVPDKTGTGSTIGKKGCVDVLKAFIDHISEREKENFRSRKRDNDDSVTLTTIHQSKGLEWDVVFIVKVNESEVPLFNEHHGIVKEIASSVEEERRLLYVAMTRARKKIYMLYVIMDSNWQMLQPSRFLREIPCHLQDVQVGMSVTENKMAKDFQKNSAELFSHGQNQMKGPRDSVSIHQPHWKLDEVSGDFDSTYFLKRFNMENRAFVSNIFHQWAKKQAFQDPKRLLLKVECVIDERLRSKKSKQKDVMRALKSCLHCDEAFQFAEYVLRWEQIPPETRALLVRERQEHFQKQRMENAMTSAAPTSKQIAYLHTLGCTTIPNSRLEASRLIEQYKSL